MAYARGNREAFVRRLGWDGLDVQRVRDALSDDRTSIRTPLPAWTTILTETMEEHRPAPPAAAVRPTSEAAYFSPDATPRFVEVWVPFVRCARRLLQRRIADLHDLLSETAHIDLERRLLLQLSQVSELALFERFGTFRASRIGDGEPGEGRRVYDAFLVDLWTGEISGFFTEYSVLARQAARLVETWIDSTAEFVERLASDRDAISKHFGGGSPGQVVAIAVITTAAR